MLRPIEPNDLDLLYLIENNPEQWQFAPTSVPFSRQFLQEYIFSTTGDIFTDKQVRMVVCNDGGEAVGFADLQNFDPKNLRAEVGITILPECRKQGLATAALRDLLDYAHRTVHLHQVYAFAAEENSASQKLMQKCGFRRQSTLEDWLFDGEKYQNAIFFQRFL